MHAHAIFFSKVGRARLLARFSVISTRSFRLGDQHRSASIIFHTDIHEL